MMRRALPYPLLTASLLLMWMLLTSFSLGQFLLGAVIAVAASCVMEALQPSKPSLRRWRLIPRLAGIVALDILRSNVAVAAIIVQGRRRHRVSGFVAIPLDLRDKTGLAVLSCIVTSTPGTAWIEYAHESGVLLIHVLDLVDEDEWVALIKNRYEAQLMEIFE
jgi:multicomponent K+:H+ antiporter subunit E